MASGCGDPGGDTCGDATTSLTNAMFGLRAITAEDAGLLLFLESETRQIEQARPNGRELVVAEERTTSLAPGALVRVGRCRVKGGVLVPMQTTRRDPPWRVSLALEVVR